MQYSLEERRPASLAFRVSIPAKDVTAMLASAGRKAPGHAAEAARSMLVNGAIEHILAKEDFIPLFRPAVEMPELAEGRDLEFRLAFDAVPAGLALPEDLSALSVDVPAPELAYAEAVRQMERLKQGRPGMTDEEVASSLGFSSHDDLWKAVFTKVTTRCFQRFRAEGQSRLLDSLLEGQSFDVPERLTAFFLEELVQDAEQASLASRRKGLSDAERDSLRREGQAAALDNARAHCLLLALARRQGVSLAEKDVDDALKGMAAQASVSVEEMRARLEAGPGMELLRQRLEANKALAFLYDKASKRVVDASGKPVEAPVRS